MNSNLKITKPVLGLVYALIIYTNTSAQTNIKLSIGASVTPTITASFNTSSSNEIVNETYQTYKYYTDSTSKSETFRTSFGASVWVWYALNKNIDIQTGITLIDVGYQRQLKDLKFTNKTYPGIGTGFGNGIVVDNSNSQPKNIDLNYLYQYLQIPILLNFDLKHTRDFKYEFYFNTGIGINILLNHQLQAKMVGSYTIEGKNEYNIDSTGYSANNFAINAMVGGTMKYKYEKNIYLFAQPIIGFYPVSVSNNQISSYPFYASLNLGIVYSLIK